MLTPEQQPEFVGDQPEVFLPIAGGWGRMGMNHIRLEEANEDVLAGALRAAWKLRIEKKGHCGAGWHPARDWQSRFSGASQSPHHTFVSRRPMTTGW